MPRGKRGSARLDDVYRYLTTTFLKYGEIAEELGTSEQAIKNSAKRIYDEKGAESRVQLVLLAQDRLVRRLCDRIALLSGNRPRPGAKIGRVHLGIGSMSWVLDLHYRDLLPDRIHPLRDDDQPGSGDRSISGI